MNHKTQHTHLGSTSLVQFDGSLVQLLFLGVVTNPANWDGGGTEVLPTPIVSSPPKAVDAGFIFSDGRLITSSVIPSRWTDNGQTKTALPNHRDDACRFLFVDLVQLVVITDRIARSS